MSCGDAMYFVQLAFWYIIPKLHGPDGGTCSRWNDDTCRLGGRRHMQFLVKCGELAVARRPIVRKSSWDLAIYVV